MTCQGTLHTGWRWRSWTGAGQTSFVHSDGRSRSLRRQYCRLERNLQVIKSLSQSLCGRRCRQVVVVELLTCKMKVAGGIQVFMNVIRLIQQLPASETRSVCSEIFAHSALSSFLVFNSSQRRGHLFTWHFVIESRIWNRLVRIVNIWSLYVGGWNTRSAWRLESDGLSPTCRRLHYVVYRCSKTHSSVNSVVLDLGSHWPPDSTRSQVITARTLPTLDL